MFLLALVRRLLLLERHGFAAADEGAARRKIDLDDVSTDLAFIHFKQFCHTYTSWLYDIDFLMFL